MRIGILTIEDPLFLFEFFKEFIALCNENQRKFNISIVLLCENKSKRSFSKDFLKKTTILYGKIRPQRYSNRVPFK